MTGYGCCAPLSSATCSMIHASQYCAVPWVSHSPSSVSVETALADTVCNPKEATYTHSDPFEKGLVSELIMTIDFHRTSLCSRTK